MCSDCFYSGLPARTYRTWASLITQIQAGYQAEAVFGHGTVTMKTELDRKGIDIQVNYKGKTINFQVKKNSLSREVRQGKKIKQKVEIINLYYEVPSSEVFANPKTKKDKWRKPYLEFINNTKLYRLKNGFVIFTEKYFTDEKKKLDKG